MHALRFLHTHIHSLYMVDSRGLQGRYSDSQPEYFTDFETGTSGKLKSDEKLRRCDFAHRLTTRVEAGDLTGYYAKVTRELDLEKRWEFTTIAV